MINGNPHDFIDTVYSGQDIPYRFHNKKFWLQGYNKDDGFFMEIYHCSPEESLSKTKAGIFSAFEASPSLPFSKMPASFKLAIFTVFLQ